MAFGFASGGDPDDRDLAEINVTPLVDVMLVLLIIFMITAPMLHQGIEVALPQAAAEPLPQRVENPLVVSIDRNGMTFVQETPVHTSQLVDRLVPLLRARGDDTVYLKADRDLAYGKVMEVLDILHQGGIVHVGMVTERNRSRG